MSSNGGGLATGSTVVLCVGGQCYSTTRETLTLVPNSKLAGWFAPNPTAKLDVDREGRYQIDRDGSLFRHILNYLRNKGALSLPENFPECDLLRLEAEYYGLDAMVKSIRALQSAIAAGQSQAAAQRLITTKTGSLSLVPPLSPGGTAGSGDSVSPSSPSPNYFGGYGIPKGAGGPGFITVGYRGSFAFGRDGLADVKFRKLTKILVSGRVAICREVFGDTLNESRDPDHCDDDNRYTARFFLKHLILEQAFDCLQEAGFRCVGSCGSGTASMPANEPQKPGIESEETRWNHYNEFVFCRP